MATRPPRITSTTRQRTTRGGPVVTGRARQPTTGGVNWGHTGRGPSQISTGSFTTNMSTLPGVPAAGASPAYSINALPPDASYDAQIAAAQRQRDDQIAALGQARSGGLLD